MAAFELRAEAKVRGSLDEVQARLAKLETSTERATPLRAVG